MFDRRAVSGVTRFVTQSEYTAALIRESYDRRAGIAGAPVDCSLFRPSGRPPGDYFLLSGRLIEPYKRPGIVIDAFRKLPHRLLVAGDGPALADLRRGAPPNVEFLGQLEDAALVEAMQGARAGIFPSQDDFGLIPVEFMACGRPVIAYRAGGAMYTIRPGVTGDFFTRQDSEAVTQAVLRFAEREFDASAIRSHAMTWDRSAFRSRLIDEATRLVSGGSGL